MTMNTANWKLINNTTLLLHHTFNGPLSGTTRYQKGKTNLDFTEARDSRWQWHQLGRIQVCTSFQTDKHASTPSIRFILGRMPFLPPNQQRQSTEGSTLRFKLTAAVVCHIPNCWSLQGHAHDKTMTNTIQSATGNNAD